MQAHVPRDADGASPYRLAVVDVGSNGLLAATSRSSTTTRPVASTRSSGPRTRSPRSSRWASARACCRASTSRSTRPCCAARSTSSAPHVEARGHRPARAGRPLGAERARAAVRARRRRGRPARAPARLAGALDRVPSRRSRALVGRFLEVAPAHADGAHRPRADDASPDVELLHAEHDRDVVLELRASGGVRPGGGAHRGGHVRSLTGRRRPRLRRDRPVDAGRCAASSCSRCRRGCGSTSSTRRRRSTSSSRACRRGATRC